MKKSTLFTLLIAMVAAYSCNVAKTCPTYAKAKNPAVVTAK
jgi:hypothetical protein